MNKNGALSKRAADCRGFEPVASVINSWTVSFDEPQWTIEK